MAFEFEIDQTPTSPEFEFTQASEEVRQITHNLENTTLPKLGDAIQKLHECFRSKMTIHQNQLAETYLLLHDLRQKLVGFNNSEYLFKAGQIERIMEILKVVLEDRGKLEIV